jgi:hypothetical protein
LNGNVIWVKAETFANMNHVACTNIMPVFPPQITSWRTDCTSVQACSRIQKSGVRVNKNVFSYWIHFVCPVHKQELFFNLFEKWSLLTEMCYMLWKKRGVQAKLNAQHDISDLQLS